jgi:threonyl-tRNA synthetase
MRLLLIHVDTFSFAVSGEARTHNFTPDPAEAGATGEVTNALVAFTAVEKVDESAPDDVVAQAADAISHTAARVGAGTVVVYPYAHLSSTLSTASFAAETLRALEAALKECVGGNAVARAPFGYYKSFRLDCKGHPLSELSRTLVPSKATPDDSESQAQGESAAVLAEKDVTSDWRIYLADGATSRRTSTRSPAARHHWPSCTPTSGRATARLRTHPRTSDSCATMSWSTTSPPRTPATCGGTRAAP